MKAFKDMAGDDKHFVDATLPFHTHTQAEWPPWWAANSPPAPTHCKPPRGRCTWLLASGSPRWAEGIQAGLYSMLVPWEIKVTGKDYSNTPTFSPNLNVQEWGRKRLLPYLMLNLGHSPRSLRLTMENKLRVYKWMWQGDWGVQVCAISMKLAC